MITALFVSAQITITGADMPVSGVVNIVSVDTSSNPDIGVASASPQAWDFSALVTHYPQVASYSPITPYQAYANDFPGANLFTYGPSILYAGFYGGAPVNFNNWGYMYWKTGADGFHVMGSRVNYGVGDTSITENPQELLMGAPASYDSVFNNTSRWVASFNKNPFDPDTNYISTVTKTLTCDAFGTMTTPFGIFNVLRVHEYMIIVDSVTATLGSITYWGSETSRDTMNNYHFWANGIGYPVAIVKADAHNNIKRTEYLSDTIPGFTVTGTVYKTDGVTPITKGKTELIAKTAIDELYGVPEVVDVDAGGHFQFSQIINGGNFLIHAKPDIDLFPYNVPTYYGDSIYWQDAATLAVLSDTAVVIDTRSDSLGYSLIGNGIISGTIWQNLGGLKTMALAGGVKVTLEQNPSGAVMRHTFTDEMGQYTFTDLPQIDFRLKVDIAAVTMDSTYYVYYSAGDTTTDNLDFYYDSTFIYVYNTASLEDFSGGGKFCVMIYPNPFRDRSFLYFNNAKPGLPYVLDIYDLTGRAITRISGETPLPVRIERPVETSGILLYEVKINGVRCATGKLVVY